MSTDVTQILTVVFLALGCFSLSIVLLTVNACKKVKRDPVFVNFLRTWLIWGGFMLYKYVVDMVNPGELDNEELSIFQTGFRDILWFAAQVATLNLVINTWVRMKIARKERTAKGEATRIIMLIMTPYLAGLIGIMEIFPRTTGRIRNPGSWNIPLTLALGCIYFVVTTITLIWTVILVITFWRDQQILRQANLDGVLPMSILLRLLFLCVYQLGMTTFCGLLLALPVRVLTGWIPLAESICPLLVFFLLGVRKDVWEAWVFLTMEMLGHTNEEYIAAEESADSRCRSTSITTTVILEEDLFNGSGSVSPEPIRIQCLSGSSVGESEK